MLEILFFAIFVNSLSTSKKWTRLVTLISGVFLDSSGDQPFVGKLIFHGKVTHTLIPLYYEEADTDIQHDEQSPI